MNKQQLGAKKNQGEKQLDAIKNYDAKKVSFKELEFPGEKNQKKRKLSGELHEINEYFRDKKLLCMDTDGREYNFNNIPHWNSFTMLLKLVTLQ